MRRIMQSKKTKSQTKQIWSWIKSALRLQLTNDNINNIYDSMDRVIQIVLRTAHESVPG